MCCEMRREALGLNQGDDLSKTRTSPYVPWKHDLVFQPWLQTQYTMARLGRASPLLSMPGGFRGFRGSVVLQGGGASVVPSVVPLALAIASMLRLVLDIEGCRACAGLGPEGAGVYTT